MKKTKKYLREEAARLQRIEDAKAHRIMIILDDVPSEILGCNYENKQTNTQAS